MITLKHRTGIVKASVDLPSSKSISNRALIIRFLSGSSLPLHRLSNANDTVVLAKILGDLQHAVDVQDAGTSFRFLTAALAITPGEWILTGTNRLKERPVHALVEALRTLGADIRYGEKDQAAPLIIHGKKIAGGMVTLDVSDSSQFVSALLMIAPSMENGLHLKLSGSISSRPYIQMTLRMMEEFGVSHRWNKKNEIMVQKQEYRFRDFTVEPDWSAASTWFEIAALSQGAEIMLNGLHTHSLQGDEAIVSMMKSFGVTITAPSQGIQITKSAEMNSSAFFECDCRDTPDLAPALIVTAAGSGRQSRISGLENLNQKESKRKDVLTEELRAQGIHVFSDSGTVRLEGGKINSSPHFSTHSDHRMAMSFAPLALKADSVSLDDETVVKKSYPDFWNHLEKAGFEIR